MAAGFDSAGAGQRLGVVRVLADGRPHAARALAERTGVDISSLPDTIGTLAETGLSVVSGADGYRLSEPIELLDRARIAAMLKISPLPQLQVAGEVDSTNTAVRSVSPPEGCAAVCLAEFQHAGRGRLGRSWLMPFASGVCFSISRWLARPASQLSGLSLAIGVAVREVLVASGAAGVALKWPNDLLLAGGKLGGILVEVTNAAEAGTRVITGIGINVTLSQAARRAVRASGGQAAALADAVPNISRNELAAGLINAVAHALQRYESDGLNPFREAWNRADAMSNQPVRVFAGSETVEGVARGIDQSGALAVDVAGGRRYFAGGEVSLRRMGDAAD